MKRFVLLLLLLTTSAAQPAPAPQLDWLWQRDTPMCTLRQTYSPEGGIVQLSRSPGNDQTSFWVGSAKPIVGMPHVDRFDEGKVIFIPNGASEADFAVAKDKGREETSGASDDPAFLDKFAKSRGVELTHAKMPPLRIPVRSAGPAVEAIRNCEDARMRQWGIDPAEWRALKVRPLPAKDWAKWIGPEDYPIGALLDLQQGFMVLKLDVGPDGRVRSCEQRIGERPAQRQPRVCFKIKRQARFEPAIGAAGQPVVAPYVLVIRFQIA